MQVVSPISTAETRGDLSQVPQLSVITYHQTQDTQPVFVAGSPTERRYVEGKTETDGNFRNQIHYYLEMMIRTPVV